MTDSKLNYIETVPLGTLVAFNDEKGKARTAAIVERNVEEKTLVVETEFKKKFNVTFDNVLWVKVGTRWPKGVYNLLKGKSDEAE